MFVHRGALLMIATLFTFGVMTPGTTLLAAQRVESQVASASMPMRTDTLHYAQPGDVVRLRIWREPDMSGDFTIDASGRATLPRLGPIAVTTVLPDSLQRFLIAEYARYLKNPSVEVLVLRRVRVAGAVRTPGLYTADQTMRVRDVLAMAGGSNSEGRTDMVRLDRNGQSTSLNLKSASAQDITLRSGDQLYVPERSWFARNTPLVAAIVSVGGGLAIALSNR